MQKGKHFWWVFSTDPCYTECYFWALLSPSCSWFNCNVIISFHMAVVVFQLAPRKHCALKVGGSGGEKRRFHSSIGLEMTYWNWQKKSNIIGLGRYSFTLVLLLPFLLNAVRRAVKFVPHATVSAKECRIFAQMAQSKFAEAVLFWPTSFVYFFIQLWASCIRSGIPRARCLMPISCASLGFWQIK